jgi:hypothetical protein
MPIEEQQQIEIARLPHAPDVVEEISDSLWRHTLAHHEEGRQYT